MKKMIKTRNLIIISLCITIIILGIGFAILSLKLKDLEEQENIFDISIIEVEEDTHKMGGITPPNAVHSILKSKKTISSNLTLNYPKDEISYRVRIKNIGTIPGRIVDVIETPNISNKEEQQNILPLDITHNDIKDRVINPNEELEINVIVKYNEILNPLPKNIKYDLTIVSESTKEN